MLKINAYFTDFVMTNGPFNVGPINAMRAGGIRADAV